MMRSLSSTSGRGKRCHLLSSAVRGVVISNFFSFFVCFFFGSLQFRNPPRCLWSLFRRPHEFFFHRFFLVLCIRDVVGFVVVVAVVFFFRLPKAGLGNCRPAAFRRHPIDPALNTGLISQRTRPACLIFRNQPERSRSIAVSGADRTEDNEKRKTG